MTSIPEVLRDEPVRREMEELVDRDMPLPKGERWSVSPTMVKRVLAAKPADETELSTRPFTEAVILQFARPVLLIRNNRIELPRSRELRARLLAARRQLEPRLPSVGRIEFTGHPELRWGGTGWVIAPRVIVTNRHVAELFAQRRGKGFAFKVNVIDGAAMTARIDFREEYDRDTREVPSFEVSIKRLQFIAEDRKDAPDIAFLELDDHPGLPAPIPLVETLPSDDADIAVVGYPGRDPRGTTSVSAAHRIFGDIYGVKRLAPGKVLIADKDRWWFFTHDASTLGGNSGSVVLDLTSGGAVGLHFSGELAEANFAVNAPALLEALDRRKLRGPVLPPAAARPAPPEEHIDEATPADYADRAGFDPTFLGPGMKVTLPTNKRHPQDVLTFTIDGQQVTELKYRHFSLAMSRSRKLCLWSAVNIDGNSTRKGHRPGWRIDPRIPKTAQTIGDANDPACDVYGDEPRFARGHMTRREDPIWGALDEAQQGNSDSMHLTNAIPQMQPFNAGIWNGLEDYALEHAREDRMRISVITGPVLANDDPERYGVQIPIECWKVIAFVHDQTGRLTATGYVMSQASFLEPEEFVYGHYETYQVPIKTIEAKTRLDFGRLRQRDPMRDQDEAAPPQLGDFADIRFVSDA